jgi:hypothetical protein
MDFPAGRNDASIIVLFSFWGGERTGRPDFSGGFQWGNRIGGGGGKASGILGGFAPMRWLMIGLLVSLGALLFAAGGVARHIWLQRRKHRMERLAALNATQETDVEVEP